MLYTEVNGGVYFDGARDETLEYIEIIHKSAFLNSWYGKAERLRIIKGSLFIGKSNAYFPMLEEVSGVLVDNERYFKKSNFPKLKKIGRRRFSTIKEL